MGKLTRKVYLPATIYKWLPLLYLVAGIIIWMFVDHMVGRLVAVALVVFAIVVLLQRFLKPPDYNRRR